MIIKKTPMVLLHILFLYVFSCWFWWILSLFLVLCFCHLFLFIILFVSLSYCSHSINVESSYARPWIFVHIIIASTMLLSSLSKLYVLNFHTLLLLLLKGLWWLLQCCFPQFKVNYKVMCLQKKSKLSSCNLKFFQAFNTISLKKTWKLLIDIFNFHP